jgi:hypothetical protein
MDTSKYQFLITASYNFSTILLGSFAPYQIMQQLLRGRCTDNSKDNIANQIKEIPIIIIAIACCAYAPSAGAITRTLIAYEFSINRLNYVLVLYKNKRFCVKN